MAEKVKKPRKRIYDLDRCIDAACYIFNTDRSILLSPADTRERSILMYCLYVLTDLTYVKLGLIFGMDARSVSLRVEKIDYQRNPKKSGFVQSVKDDITDIRQYLQMISPIKKSFRDIVNDIRKEWVESHGVDILEFVRWERKKQVEWINAHREDVATLKKEGKIEYTDTKAEIEIKKNLSKPPTNIG